MGHVIDDFCFKSQEIALQNKFADASWYFSTQNTSMEYWAMFERKNEEGLFGGNSLDCSGLQNEQRTRK